MVIVGVRVVFVLLVSVTALLPLAPIINVLLNRRVVGFRITVGGAPVPLKVSTGRP